MHIETAATLYQNMGGESLDTFDVFCIKRFCDSFMNRELQSFLLMALEKLAFKFPGICFVLHNVLLVPEILHLIIN
jgi:hypothetical protein